MPAENGAKWEKSEYPLSATRHFSNDERQPDDHFEPTITAAILSGMENYASEEEKP